MPTLVIHGDSDAIVPLEVSGKRSAGLAHRQLSWWSSRVGPHGLNASHADEFNTALLDFLG